MDGRSARRKNKGSWTRIRLNSHFNDGKGFISISTSMEEHLKCKRPALWWWNSRFYFVKLKPHVRGLHLVTMLQWLNRCDKLKTNLTQWLTRALALGVSPEYHFAPARDLRSGTKLYKNDHFILITDFLTSGFCTNVLKGRIWKSPSRRPPERFVFVSAGQAWQTQETHVGSENTPNKGLPHGLNDCWVHGKKCQRITTRCMSRKKNPHTHRKTHTRTAAHERVRYKLYIGQMQR